MEKMCGYAHKKNFINVNNTKNIKQTFNIGQNDSLHSCLDNVTLLDYCPSSFLIVSYLCTLTTILLHSSLAIASSSSKFEGF